MDFTSLSGYALFSLFCAIAYYPISRILSTAETRLAVKKIVESPKKVFYLVDKSRKKGNNKKTVLKPYRMLLMFNLTIIALALAILPTTEVLECSDGEIIESNQYLDGNEDCTNGEDENTTIQMNSRELNFKENAEFHIDGSAELNWFFLLIFAGPLLISYMTPWLVYEYCPMYVLSPKNELLTKFGKEQNRFLEPAIGTGAIIAPGQLILRESWGTASFEEIGMLITYTIAAAFCISIGQFVLLFLLSGRMRKDSQDIVTIYLALKIAYPVTIDWENPSNLITKSKLSKKDSILDKELAKKYKLEGYIDDEETDD